MRKSHEEVHTTIAVIILLALCLSFFGLALSSGNSSAAPVTRHHNPSILIKPVVLVPSTTTSTSTTIVPPTTTTTTIPYVPPTTTTTIPSAPVTTPAVAVPATSGDLYAEWTKVAVCEEGGWIGYAGPAYPDSLGIDAQNWYAYGGGSDVSPSAQIAVAENLITSLGASIPDQDGCAAW